MIYIDGYPIDVAVTEEHVYEAEVTQHPVETGSNIGDHMILAPAVVSIEGIVSDTPLPDIVIARLNAFLDGDVSAFDESEFEQGSGPLPSDEALARLLGMRAGRRAVTIETSLGTYKNMMLTSLSIPRSADTGDALHFRATFTEITIVTNQRTRKVVRTATPRGKGKDAFRLVPTYWQDTRGRAIFAYELPFNPLGIGGDLAGYTYKDGTRVTDEEIRRTVTDPTTAPRVSSGNRVPVNAMRRQPYDKSPRRPWWTSEQVAPGPLKTPPNPSRPSFFQR